VWLKEILKEKNCGSSGFTVKALPPRRKKPPIVREINPPRRSAIAGRVDMLAKF
jgi:hypothetical protein